MFRDVFDSYGIILSSYVDGDVKAIHVRWPGEWKTGLVWRHLLNRYIATFWWILLKLYTFSFKTLQFPFWI